MQLKYIYLVPMVIASYQVCKDFLKLEYYHYCVCVCFLKGLMGFLFLLFTVLKFTKANF